MSDKRRDVIGSLPSTRPHRRSGRRAAPEAEAPAGETVAATRPAASANKTVKKPARPAKKAAGDAGVKKPAAPAKRSSTAAGKPAVKRAGTPPQASADTPARTRAAKQPGKPAAKKPPANVRSRSTGARPARPAPRPHPVAEPSPTPDRPGTVETLVQAAAELTEIGLKASARAVRGAVSRLPKP